MVFFLLLLSLYSSPNNHCLSLPIIVFAIFLFASHRLSLHDIFLFVDYEFFSSSSLEYGFSLWIFTEYVFSSWVFIFLFPVGFSPPLHHGVFVFLLVGFVLLISIFILISIRLLEDLPI